MKKCLNLSLLALAFTLAAPESQAGARARLHTDVVVFAEEGGYLEDAAASFVVTNQHRFGCKGEDYRIRDVGLLPSDDGHRGVSFHARFEAPSPCGEYRAYNLTGVYNDVRVKIIFGLGRVPVDELPKSISGDPILEIPMDVHEHTIYIPEYHDELARPLRFELRAVETLDPIED